MSRRSTEMLLLLLAAPPVLLLYIMLLLNQGTALSLSTLAVPIGLFGAFAVAHFAIRVFAPNADPAILPIVFVLSSLGITFVTRLAPESALGQVMWLFMGVVALVLVLMFLQHIDTVSKYKYTLMLFGVVLLLSPLLPVVGLEANGSRLWLNFHGLSFQPGEIAKVLLVLFLGGYLAQNRELLSISTMQLGPFHIPDLRALVPILAVGIMAFIIVIFEKDLGSALIVFTLFLAMLYVGSGRKLYLLIGLGIFALGAVVLYSFFGHVQTRVAIWQDPFSDAAGAGYQLVQSIYSLVDGGLFGVGIGRGLADNIPFASTDFIFAAIAEESGLLGSGAVLLLYLLLAVRGFATASRARSDVSSFIAVGATLVIVLQAFIIIGGVTKLIPLTGITLPFMSRGGSSLLASFISIGLILRCGDEGTGFEKELQDGTGSMSALTKLGESNETGVLGRVALGNRLTATIIALALMFSVLLANLTYIMVVKADEYKAYPGNNHTLIQQAKTQRGSISTADGVILAESVKEADGTYTRTYPQGTLASHVLGYYSTKYGYDGIEKSMNDALQGNSHFGSWQDVIDHSSGINQPGNDVVLTINSSIQQTAEEVLDGYKGAVVVMDSQTGAILASASSPAYSMLNIENILAQENAGTSGELLNRVTNVLYAPGSTFKVVTATSLIENDVANSDTIVSAPGEKKIGGSKVTNYAKEEYGDVSLSYAMAVSSNTALGQLGVQLGADRLAKTAELFGFNKRIDTDLPVTTSIMANPNVMDTWETAWAAAGQPVGEHADGSPAGPQATVLQMAMVADAVANNGVIQTPYFVESVYNTRGERSYKATPHAFATVMNKDTAQEINLIMQRVISSGTGTNAALDTITVAGKTGTAETGKERDDSWFIGFAPADSPRIVIAIVIEEGVYLDEDGNVDDTGQAARKARAVLQEALEQEGIL